jgi:predicted dehydrogenase
MSRDSGSDPILAVIGCGAIAEALHLPALARRRSVASRMILVDPDTERARALAQRFGAASVCADYREVLGRADAAIVAVPRRLHHPIALACVQRGLCVLCEKPLCESAEDAREIIAAAERAGVAVALNQTRRLFPSLQKVRELLEAGAIGRPKALEYVLGEVFDWPAASGSYFGVGASGRGILLEQGAHIVDLVCWWLGGRPTLTSYRDDSFGGTEAVAELQLESAGCHARIHLSWLSRLESGYRVEGETGSLAGGAYDFGTLQLRSGGRTRTLKTDWQPREFGEFGDVLVDNFLEVVTRGARPLVSAPDVLPSLELIDQCYRRRERFPMPWHDAWERIARD